MMGPCLLKSTLSSVLAPHIALFVLCRSQFCQTVVVQLGVHGPYGIKSVGQNSNDEPGRPH